MCVRVCVCVCVCVYLFIFIYIGYSINLDELEQFTGNKTQSEYSYKHPYIAVRHIQCLTVAGCVYGEHKPMYPYPIVLPYTIICMHMHDHDSKYAITHCMHAVCNCTLE